MSDPSPIRPRRDRLGALPRWLQHAALLIAGTSLGSAALAQVAPNGPGAASGGGTSAATDALETVTVTAQFRQQNLQQTPIAITAITGAMLEQRNQTSLEAIAADAPNVVLEQNPAGGGNSMRAQIRGVGQTDFDPAVDPGVGIYIDDVYFATLTASDFALLDLDRIEILRGPQGTLSGMDSLGGSVKLYTRKPNGSGEMFLEGTYGSFDRTEFRGVGDFTVVPDRLFVRISGASRRESGYVQLFDYACTHPADPYVISGAIAHGNSTPDCSAGTEGGIDYTALRVSLRWLAASNLEINWATDVTQDDSGSTATTLLGTTPINTLPWAGAPYDNRYVPSHAYASYANFLDPGFTYRAINVFGAPGAPNGAFYANPNNTLSAWGSAATVDWGIGGSLSLKSITAYRSYNSRFGDDNSASPIPLVLEEAQFRHRQFSEEVRLNGSLGKLLDYTLGGIYFDQRTIYASREDDPFVPFGTPAQPTFDFLQDDPTTVKTKAGFLHTAWHLTDALTLNAGTRYTDENKTYTFERLNPDGFTPYLPLSNPGNPLNGTVGRFDGSHVDYRLDFEYQWTPALMTYAEWSTGFKGGGITPRPYFPQQVIGFGPETLKSYELGMKSQWFDDRLRLNLAAFEEYYDGYQAFATPSTCVDASGQPLPPPYNNPCGEYRNVADANGKGGEAELTWRPLDALQIDGTWSYLDLHFTQSTTTAVLPGQSVPQVGKVRASLGGQYAWTLGGAGSLTLRVDGYYTPGFCGDVTCDSFVQNSAYTLLNGRLTYSSADDKWSVALQGTNLTGRLYYITKTYTGAGYIDGQIGPPREWAVTVRREL